MDEEQVIVQQDGAVATVVLNRPDRLNALVKPMWTLLAAAFRKLSADDGVRCVVLRGAGQSFSPGADASEFKAERFDAAHAETYGKLVAEAFAEIRTCSHPVIAAIRGPCTGSGLVLALLSDLCISGESGCFGASSSKLGLALPYPEFSVLFDALGRSLALELVLDGRLIEAPEALVKGIVNQVVPDVDLEQTVAVVADRIAAGAPLVNRWHKSFASRLATGAPLTEAEISASYKSFDTEDYQAGYRAFLRKQQPTFKGQ
jgi:enoyl-CoA hydratase/carnithine racemase